MHWNFFFTLGLLPPFVAASQSALRVLPSHAALALLLAVTYQMALETTGLKAFMLAAPRTGLVSMNREGIFGFWGYWPSSWPGQDAGMYVLPRSLNPRSGSNGAIQRNTLLLTILVWSAIWSALYVLATDFRYGAGPDRVAPPGQPALRAVGRVLQHASDPGLLPHRHRLLPGLLQRRRRPGRAPRPRRRHQPRAARLQPQRPGPVPAGQRRHRPGQHGRGPRWTSRPSPPWPSCLAYAAAITAAAVGLDMCNISIKL